MFRPFTAVTWARIPLGAPFQILQGERLGLVGGSERFYG